MNTESTQDSNRGNLIQRVWWRSRDLYTELSPVAPASLSQSLPVPCFLVLLKAPKFYARLVKARPSVGNGAGSVVGK